MYDSGRKKGVTQGLSLRPANATAAVAVPSDHLSLQRKVVFTHTSRPAIVQRQVAAPALKAAALHSAEVQRLSAERLSVQRQAAEIQLPQSAVEAALQRKQAIPAPVPTNPQSIGDWVTVMRFQAEQAEGRRMGAKEAAQFTALQRQVAQTMSRSYLTDQQSAVQRQQDYAAHVVALQRHPVSVRVARAFMQSVPQGERAALQRAVDDVSQQEALQRQQDEQALKLHTLQRQLAELDQQATQPVFERIQQRRGAGNPLPEAIQRHLEQGLNHDLSAVRIHDDAEADKLAKGVNAIAFTTGTDIYFQSGKFNPNSQSGLELLAHEVTHTVQQSKGQVGKGVDPDSGLESEARAMGKRLSHMRTATRRNRFHSSSSTTQTSARLSLGSKSLAIAAPLSVATSLQRRVQQSQTGEPVGKRGFVREDGLNLREQPNQQSKSLGTFPFGTKVMVAARQGEWYQVLTATGKSGFMLASKVHGLDARHQAMLRQDPGLRLFRVKPGETGMQLVKRAYGITGAEGSRDQNLWHFLNIIRKNNQAGAFGYKDLGFKDAVQNALVPGADANNVLLKANTDLWIPSFVVAAKDNSVGSGTLRGEAARLGKNVSQKVQLRSCTLHSGANSRAGEGIPRFC